MAVVLGRTFREHRQCKILKARHRTGVFRTWVGKHWGIPLLNVYALFLVLGSDLGGRSAIEGLLSSSALEPRWSSREGGGHLVTVDVNQLPLSALLRPRLSTPDSLS